MNNVKQDNNSLEISKPLKALDLCVKPTQGRYTFDIECCDPRGYEMNSDRNNNTSKGGVLVKEDLRLFFEKKAVKWKDYGMNMVDSHCHFEMLFSK